jgi:hypothetical protein
MLHRSLFSPALLLFLAACVTVSDASARTATYRRGQVSGLSATFRSQRLQTALGFGGVGLGLGIAGGVLVSNAPTASDKSTGVAALSVGIAMTVVAGVSALVRTPYERAADDFLREAANEDSEAVERRFAALLANERSERRVLSIMNAVLSGAAIAIGLTASTSAREILLGLGAGGIAVSVVNFVVPPPMPFEALGAGGGGTAQRPSSIRFGVSPLPGGAALAGGWSF